MNLNKAGVFEEVVTVTHNWRGCLRGWSPLQLLSVMHGTLTVTQKTNCSTTTKKKHNFFFVAF